MEKISVSFEIDSLRLIEYVADINEIVNKERNDKKTGEMLVKFQLVKQSR